MIKSIRAIVFLFGMIYFIPFSCGQGDPKTVEEVGVQLKSSAYSAGKDKFNSLAFGIIDDDIKVIKASMKENGKDATVEDSGHIGEVFIDCTVYVYDGEMTYCSVVPSDDYHTVIKRIDIGYVKDNYLDLNFSQAKRTFGSDISKKTDDRYDIMIMSQRYDKGVKTSPEFYELISKIVGNITRHTNSKYMVMWLSFYYDDSEFKCGIDWHRDWWDNDNQNPNILAFAVLDVTLPTAKKVSDYAKIKLGLINIDYQNLYGPNKIVLEKTRSPCYGSRYNFRMNYFEGETTGYCDNTGVRRLIELDNYTGSGYIVDQSMVINTDAKIVHSRDYRGYQAGRLSMVLRGFSFGNEKEMKEDAAYNMTKCLGDRETYIAIPNDPPLCKLLLETVD
ncbi:MAG: hypothetical protein QS748_12080 [Candidatus Endonucleobacter bathymodioli]|uniref:Uncharacterized protein n=1 Tax=Candidatus Endonucleibacter bathymodioli TaxID=539814 RepID=A0AA90NN69_9GAMM|nr:hypothetical protein [Candidatus Endonucleobacter bathymodioli]